MSTLSEIGDYLEGLGLGSQSGNEPTLRLGGLEDAPDDVVCIYQYPGGGNEWVQDKILPVAERPQIQVVARAKRYQDAELKIDRAWQALAIVRNTTLSGTYYRSIEPNGSPGLLKRDEHGRTLLYFNATVEKEVTVAAVS